jgi:acyl-CoA dehydrogenase
MDFSYSPRTQELQARVQRFMEDHIYPNEQRYWDELEANTNAGKRWTPLALIEALKPKARAQGLWNLFLPESDYGAGLTNQEYAPLAEIMGRTPWASEVFNCSAPDTGNMETIVRYGTAEQKKQWLEPLLDGRIRSAFAMTEPDVASSDATNITARIQRDGDDYVLNGRKWWTSGAGDPRCKVYIFMGKTDPDAPRHSQQSMRRTATWRCCSRTCACPRPTCCSARAAASRSRRVGWAPAASTTACASSGWPSARSS